MKEGKCSGKICVVSFDRINNGYKRYTIGDLGGCVRDIMRDYVTGTFGVVGENEDGKSVRLLC